MQNSRWSIYLRLIDIGKKPSIEVTKDFVNIAAEPQ